MKPHAVAPTLVMTLVVSIALFAGASPALAEVSGTLVLGADEQAYLDDVAAKLMGTGSFSHVDTLQAQFATPSLATLQAYPSVLVYTNWPAYDPNALGDVLADYVDGGGRLAVASFAHMYGTEIGGRLQSEGYLTFHTGNWSDGAAYMVPVISDHYLLHGVSSFHGGSASFRSSVWVTAGSTVVAEWTDGLPLVAIKPRVNTDVIGLNLFPVSSSMDDRFWDVTTDGARLLANALAPPQADWDPTPPVIVGSVSPAPNAAGWHNSMPRVSWSVTDPESGIRSIDGCATEWIAEEAAGITRTCTATNLAGGTSSSTLTLNVDRGAPTLTAELSPAPNARGWNNTPVDVTFVCSDAVSGIAGCPGTFTFGEGKGQTASGTAMDVAGNTAALTRSNINVDLGAPVTTVTSPPVVVRRANQRIYGFATDNLSGIQNILLTLTPRVGFTYQFVATCSARCGSTSVPWSAIVPDVVPAGLYTVTASSWDKADLRSPDSAESQVLIL